MHSRYPGRLGFAAARTAAISAGAAGLVLGMSAMALPTASASAAPRDRQSAAWQLLSRIPGGERPGSQISHARGDNYGFSVAISGTTAAVGAVGVKNNAGAVYLFIRSGGRWRHQATLPDPGHTAWDHFGWSVAVSSTPSGTFAVIGAIGADNLSGVSYIFGRSGSSWHLQATLADPASPNLDNFGFSVAASGGTVVVGTDATGAANHAYIFVRSGTTWHRQATLADPGGKENDQFGSAVAISGSTAIIGAWGANGYSGAAYLFTRRSNGTWSKQARLTEPGTHGKDNFAWSVAISGATAVIGTPGTGRGVADIFARSAGTWHRQARLIEPPAVNGNEFGYAVAVWGTRALIADPRQTQHRCGGVYEYRRSGSAWGHPARVINPGCTSGDWFGNALALAGQTALIGAPQKNHMAGQAYLLTVP